MPRECKSIRIERSWWSKKEKKRNNNSLVAIYHERSRESSSKILRKFVEVFSSSSLVKRGEDETRYRTHEAILEGRMARSHGKRSRAVESGWEVRKKSARRTRGKWKMVIEGRKLSRIRKLDVFPTYQKRYRAWRYDSLKKKKKKKQYDEKKRHEKARIGGKNNLKKGFNVDDT